MTVFELAIFLATYRAIKPIGANPFLLTQPPPAQPQADDERTIEDEPQR